jgi:hypothetical protein
MVNISTVVVISPDTIQSFKGFDSFWRQAMENFPNNQKAARLQHKRDLDKDAIDLANDYGINPAHMANICFIFPSYQWAKRELDDFETRDLLCNPDNVITLQIRKKSSGTMLVTTVHSQTGFKIFPATLSPRTPLTKVLCENEE